jgi:hypothetical protein
MAQNPNDFENAYAFNAYEKPTRTGLQHSIREEEEEEEEKTPE